MVITSFTTAYMTEIYTVSWRPWTSTRRPWIEQYKLQATGIIISAGFPQPIGQRIRVAMRINGERIMKTTMTTGIRRKSGNHNPNLVSSL
jgi:hypothetical protein